MYEVTLAAGNYVEKVIMLRLLSREPVGHQSCIGVLSEAEQVKENR